MGVRLAEGSGVRVAARPVEDAGRVRASAPPRTGVLVLRHAAAQQLRTRRALRSAEASADLAKA